MNLYFIDDDDLVKTLIVSKHNGMVGVGCIVSRVKHFCYTDFTTAIQHMLEDVGIAA